MVLAPLTFWSIQYNPGFTFIALWSGLLGPPCWDTPASLFALTALLSPAGRFHNTFIYVSFMILSWLTTNLGWTQHLWITFVAALICCWFWATEISLGLSFILMQIRPCLDLITFQQKPWLPKLSFLVLFSVQTVFFLLPFFFFTVGLHKSDY